MFIGVDIMGECPICKNSFLTTYGRKKTIGVCINCGSFEKINDKWVVTSSPTKPYIKKYVFWCNDWDMECEYPTVNCADCYKYPPSSYYMNEERHKEQEKEK